MGTDGWWCEDEGVETGDSVSADFEDVLLRLAFLLVWAGVFAED